MAEDVREEMLKRSLGCARIEAGNLNIVGGAHSVIPRRVSTRRSSQGVAGPAGGTHVE